VKLIVGLGNPGRIYSSTRHNIGFVVVKSLAKDCGATLKRENFTYSLTAKAKFEAIPVVIALPLTFMNLAGQAVKALVKKYRVVKSDLLVVCDDLNLELGRIRLRPSGSSGGHRGLQSIIDNLRREDFARLKIGIGRPPAGMEASDYVLKPFLKKETGVLNEAVQNACECCRVWVQENTDKAMNEFNKRSQ